MGTSSSHSGPGDAPGLLPFWATEGGNTDVAPGAADDADGNVGPEGDTAGDEGTATDAEQPAGPAPSPSPPPGNWRLAKAGMTRYANSGGGAARLRSAGSGYVRAKGGARRATSSATSGRSASRQIGNFLSAVQRSGLQQAADSIGLRDIVGQSSDHVLARLVDALAPAGSTREEAAARRATIEVLEYLYETVIGEDGDLRALERMDQETVEEAIERSVSGYIYNRWLDELGLSIESGAVTEAAAVELERDVKEYVESCVALEIGDKSAVQVDWAGREGRQIIDRVYRDAYALLEAGS